MNKFTYKEYDQLNNKFLSKLTLWDLLAELFYFMSFIFLAASFEGFRPEFWLQNSKVVILCAMLLLLIVSYVASKVGFYFRYRYINELIELKGNTNETEDT